MCDVDNTMKGLNVSRTPFMLVEVRMIILNRKASRFVYSLYELVSVTFP